MNSGLTCGVAGVTGRLALGGLGRIADHLLDGLAPLARLALDLVLGFLLRTRDGLGLLDDPALGIAGFAGRGDRRSFLPALDDSGVIRPPGERENAPGQPASQWRPR